MKVEDKRAIIKYAFDRINIGSVFQIENGSSDFFIKTNVIPAPTGHWNAVKLTTGNHYTFSDDEGVILIQNAKVVIE